MPGTRTRCPSVLKAKVALEVSRGSKTAARIAQVFSVHPNLVAQWNKHALEQLPEIFAGQHVKQQADTLKTRMFSANRRMKVERDFSKKQPAWAVEAKRRCIDPGHPQLSVRHQCERWTSVLSC